MIGQEKNTNFNWTPIQDEKLVSDFFEEVKKGKAVKEAMKEIAPHHGRTPEAALFRWYGVISKKDGMKDEFQKCKQIGEINRFKKLENEQTTEEQVKENTFVPSEETFTPSIQFEDEVSEQEEVEYKEDSRIGSSEEIEEVKSFIENAVDIYKRNKELEDKVNELQKMVDILQKQNSELYDDVKTYAKIFEKARKLSVEEEVGMPSSERKPSFKMERNGNLERQ